MIEVKVIQSPGGMRPATLNEGATVQDALNTTSMSIPAGFGVKVDGQDASAETVLYDEARVVISKGAKGANR